MEGVLSFVVFFLVYASFYALCSLGLNLQWGFTGLFNVGIVGFFAIGAYACALITGPPPIRTPCSAGSGFPSRSDSPAQFFSPGRRRSGWGS